MLSGLCKLGAVVRGLPTSEKHDELNFALRNSWVCTSKNVCNSLPFQ